MNRLRIGACLVALALLTGCGARAGGSSSVGMVSQSGAVSQPTPAPLTAVRLPWFDADNLNQYSCSTLQNYYLGGLLADPLVALDSVGVPQNRLALEVSSADNLQYVITLRGDARFTDGTTLTSADVLYSLELARQSDRFASGLRGVATATAAGDGSLTITLTQPDRFFARSLCFPVLKRDTGGFPVPVGIGRFVVELENSRMVRNPHYYNPVQTLQTVTLVATDSLEEQSYGIMEGSVDLMYSDLQSDLNLGLGIGYRQIPLSNLVYLGVNPQRSWATPELRQVLSGLARREDIARRAYTGFAAIASLPISPQMATTTISAADLEVNPDRQSEQLEAQGWQLQPDNIRRRAGVPLQLELLINSDSSERQAAADILANQYRQVGIGITITALPFADYSARIAAGDYDLCIAETRLAYNMDMGGLLPAAFFPALDTLYRAVKADQSPQIELETALRTELPVIPLLFRRGVLCFSRDFSANMVATEQDIFYNIVEW